MLKLNNWQKTLYILALSGLSDLCTEYQLGDASSDVEKLVGAVDSMRECVELVKSFNNSNGATMQNPNNGPGPYACYKEQGQTKADIASFEFVNCLISFSAGSLAQRYF